MQSLKMAIIPKQERGWINKEYTGTIWYYHCNDVGKYNAKPLQGTVVRYIPEVEVIVILVENSIDVFPIMLDSRYDIIASNRKTLKKMKIYLLSNLRELQNC